MTDKERLAYAFEKTPTFFQLCTTIRSRRVGRGYRIDSGTDFKHPVTGRAISQQKGPMQFVSKKEPNAATPAQGCAPTRIFATTRGTEPAARATDGTRRNDGAMRCLRMARMILRNRSRCYEIGVDSREAAARASTSSISTSWTSSTGRRSFAATCSAVR